MPNLAQGRKTVSLQSGTTELYTEMVQNSAPSQWAAFIVIEMVPNLAPSQTTTRILIGENLAAQELKSTQSANGTRPNSGARSESVYDLRCGQKFSIRENATICKEIPPKSIDFGGKLVRVARLELTAS